MEEEKKTIDPRFSLQSYDGILHVCEDILKNFRSGIIEKGDVSAMMSIVTVSRQTLSDKKKWDRPKNPAVEEVENVSTMLTSTGPFNIVTNRGVQ
tara:strand:- start:572 stop:856 length:285 start_codon:yes stop_codon:yes gene_type:complete